MLELNYLISICAKRNKPISKNISMCLHQLKRFNSSFSKKKTAGGRSGAKTEMESVYAASLKMYVGSVLHLTCHIVVMFCVLFFSSRCSCTLSQPEQRKKLSYFPEDAHFQESRLIVG